MPKGLLRRGLVAPGVRHDVTHSIRVVLGVEEGVVDGSEVKAVDELGELLNGHLRLGFCLLRSDGLVLDGEAGLLCGVIWCAPDRDEGKQFFIEEVRLEFALEVCEEQLSELIDLDQTLLVFNHLVELLLQVIEDAMVHQVAIDRPEDVGLVPVRALHHLGEVAVNQLTPHRHRPLLLVLLHLRLPPQVALRQLQLLLGERLFHIGVFLGAIIGQVSLHLLAAQVRQDVVATDRADILLERFKLFLPSDLIVERGPILELLRVEGLAQAK